MTTVSFIIPAHDEADWIGATIAAIHAAADGLSYEIIVADDASTDGTGRIAQDAGASVVRHERRQIAATRNLGARAAAGRWLVFVDADTRVNAGAVRAAVAALEGGAAGGGASVQFDGRVPLYARVMLPMMNGLFRLLRVCGGCFVFCSRAAFDAAGGWDEGLYASEEIALAGALKRHGRFVIVRHFVLTSGRKLRTHSGWELLWVMVRAWVGGRRFFGDRARLGVWYGPRQADPHLITSDDEMPKTH